MIILSNKYCSPTVITVPNCSGPYRTVRTIHVFNVFFQKAEAAAANPQAEKAKAPGDGEENLTPNQYTEIRKKKLDEIRSKGINPYPHKVFSKKGLNVPELEHIFSSMLPLVFKNFVQSIPQLKLVVEVMTSSVLPVVFIQCALPVQSLYFMIYEQKV